MAKNPDKNAFSEEASFALTPGLSGRKPDLSKDSLIAENKGHRERLRHRYFETNGVGFPDYEYLELLLFRSIPRADTKPLAKALLNRFGSLADVLGADISLLQEVPGCGPSVARDLKILAGIAERVNRAELRKRDIFSSWDKVLGYCKAAMAHETREQFRVLFLDKKNGLIADEIQQIGTIDHTPVYPREVVKRALQLSASALVLVHNHPSGDPSPSRDDISMTHMIKDVANALGIAVHDHIIIARNGYVSFRAKKLL
ncbi:DNA repair protein RadC [Bartonella apihabitans]|uniref:RadC family protein n=1 Tax=uncultured Bartonella sp. TaxID=104108 RepID=UPI0025E03958|nr:DNA repair protein RadC [Bartonella apihabitans]WLT09563.1 DNA repair protein RadC [Bartonella apihabitans]